MAKNTKGATPVAPNFKDVDKAAVAAAQAAVQGGRQAPLTPPADARTSEYEGSTYTRWPERGVVQQAYRTVAKSGLMDVVVITKIRQSKKNNGMKVWSHFYLNNGDDISEGHAKMNERTIGAITTLLVATGFMPAGGALKGSLLDKMFPQKNQPASASPLVNKPVIVNIQQQNGPKLDPKTKKPIKDEEGNLTMEKRDQGESFLPDASTEDEGEEEEN